MLRSCKNLISTSYKSFSALPSHTNLGSRFIIKHTSLARFSTVSEVLDCGFIDIYFITKRKESIHVKARDGDTLLELAKSNNLDVEGYCQANMCCSTCHMILDPELYEKLPVPVPKEEDLLDSTTCITDTSRLGCQVRVTREFAGHKIELPKRVKNQAGIEEDNDF